MFSSYLGMDHTPSDFQEESLYELLRPDYPHTAVGVFGGPTGSGKTAVAQIAAALLGGIIVYLQPTQTLQGYHSLRMMGLNNTFVCNLDLVCTTKPEALRVLSQLETVVAMSERERPRVCLYVSPLRLHKSKTWQNFFKKAAKAGALNLIVLDEFYLFAND
jgi:superfamily II DNA helicase RecQ